MTAITFAIVLLLVIVAVLLILLGYAHSRIARMDQRIRSANELDEINLEHAVSDGFYDNVLKADITNNRLLGENCA